MLVGDQAIALIAFVGIIFIPIGTTPDLHITAGIITAGFVRTGSDVPSLSIMSLKMKKNDWG